MRPKFRHAFAVIAFLILSSSLFAQSEFVPGYIYTIQKDTLAGWIKYQDNVTLAQGCDFRQTPTGQSDHFGLNELTGFQLDKENRHFNKRKVEYLRSKREVFLEKVVSGALELYYWQDYNIGEVLYMSVKGDSMLIPFPYNQYEGYVGNDYVRRREIITSTNHRDTLLKYMPDRPDLFQDITQIKKPKLANMIPLFAKYNNVEPIAVNHVAVETVKKTFSMYITPGITNADFEVISSTGIDYYGGATLSFDFPGAYDQLVVFAGLYKRLYNGNPVFRDYNYQYKIPIGLEYRFSGRLLRPFVILGSDGLINRNSIRFILAPGAGLNLKILNNLSLSFRYKVKLVNFKFKKLGKSETLGLQFKF